VLSGDFKAVDFANAARLRLPVVPLSRVLARVNIRILELPTLIPWSVHLLRFSQMNRARRPSPSAKSVLEDEDRPISAHPAAVEENALHYLVA
jgi:hypothetical protein